MAKAEVIKGAVDLYQKMTSSNAGKKYYTPQSVAKNIYENSLNQVLQQKAQEASMLTIKSNFARDRAVVIDNGKLILVFNKFGIAQMPAHLRQYLEVEMRARPGRYTVLTDTPAEPVVEAPQVAAPVEETLEEDLTPPPVVETPEAEKVEDPKEKKTTKIKVSKEK